MKYSTLSKDPMTAGNCPMRSAKTSTGRFTVSRGIGNFTRFRKRILYALNPKIFYSLTNVLNSDKKEGKSRGAYRKTQE